MRKDHDRYDENLIRHNEGIPLAISEWQQWNDPLGDWSLLLEIESDPELYCQYYGEAWDDRWGLRQEFYDYSCCS
jgi:hypothetical protein